MITFYTTMRPFTTEFATRTQYNSVHSWQWAVPGAQVLILGGGEGVEEFSAEMGAQFVDLELAWNRPYLDDMVTTAQDMAEYDVQCLINSDIMLWPGFVDAIQVVQREFETFLMVNRRTDLHGRGSYNRLIEQHEMAALKAYAHEHGGLYPPMGSDFFATRGDVWGEIPRLVFCGGNHDSWLMWRALDRGIPMIDATWSVLALHQSHADARVCQECVDYCHTLVPQPWGKYIRGPLHATHSVMGSKQFAPARGIALGRS